MSHTRRGFTLWELVLVLTLLGVVAGVALPAYTSLGMDKGKQPVDAVLQLLRAARRLAITRGTAVSVLLDPASHRYRVDTTGLAGEIGTLVDTTLNLMPGTTLAADSARVRFVFFATGAALADSLRVRTSSGQVTVTVDPWGGIAYANGR